MRKMSVVAVLVLMVIEIAYSYTYTILPPVTGVKRGLYTDPASIPDSKDKLFEAGIPLNPNDIWKLRYDDGNLWIMWEAISQPYDYMIFRFDIGGIDKDYAEVVTRIWDTQVNDISYYIYRYHYPDPPEYPREFWYWSLLDIVEDPFDLSWVRVDLDEFSSPNRAYIMAVANTPGSGLDNMFADRITLNLFDESSVSLGNGLTGGTGPEFEPEHIYENPLNIDGGTTTNIESSSLGQIKAVYK